MCRIASAVSLIPMPDKHKECQSVSGYVRTQQFVYHVFVNLDPYLLVFVIQVLFSQSADKDKRSQLLTVYR